MQRALLAGIILAVVSVAAFDVKSLDKPLITYLCCYLLGFYVFSKQDFVKKLTGFKWELIAIFVITSAANATLYIFNIGPTILKNICNYSSFVSGIPALMCIGHEYLNKTNSLFSKFAKTSFDFYIIHFPVVVLSQYFLSLTGMNIILNFVLTLVVAYPVTYVICRLFAKVKKYYF